MPSRLKQKKLLTILISVCVFVMLCGLSAVIVYTNKTAGTASVYGNKREETANKENKAQGDDNTSMVSTASDTVVYTEDAGNDTDVSKLSVNNNGQEDNSMDNSNSINVGNSTQDDSSLVGYCTFYDYVVAPYKGSKYKPGYHKYPKESINTADNYADNGKPKLTVGTKDQNYSQNRYSCMVNGLDVNTCIYYNDGKFKTVGTFDGTTHEYYLASQGIIESLDKNDYRKVIFNVDEPGLFSDEEKTGKTVIKDYKLVFDKKDNGNRSSTYTLDYVLSPKGNKTLAGDNFFPLNDSESNVLDAGYGGASGKVGTNYYFGMRYDVEFALNGYDDDLLYKFTGDDDLWVFLDGELVLDLGGIHPECGGDVDLWKVGPLADELRAAGNVKSEVDQHKKHIITVLYMERGGNLSNCNMKFTVPDSARIITIDDYDVDKTVTLNDWENRTYDVSLGAYIKNTEGVILKDITNVTVRDYIDNRFNVIDDEGKIVTIDADYAKEHADYVCVTNDSTLTANGGSIGYDTEKNMVYVEWLNQTVENQGNSDNTGAAGSEDVSTGDIKYGWKKVIQVKASPYYAGGNNVTTNGLASGVTVNGKFKEFPRPTVNVRTIPVIKNIEDVVFYGDSFSDYSDKSEILRRVLETKGCTLGEDGTALLDEDFTIYWYKDDKLIDESKVASMEPDSDTVYKIKVKYAVSKVDENDMCTKNSKGYIADEVLYNMEKDVNDNYYDYAVYTIHVVKGQLDITKCIDEQYTDNKIIRANQTYVFRIEQYGYVNADKMAQKGELKAVFYQPVSFDANGDIIKKTAVISGLKKGFYTVSEDTDWALEYKLVNMSDNYDGNNNTGGYETKDIFIGENTIKADYDNNVRPEFYGLDNTHYGYIADGEPAQTQFTNNKNTGWRWLSDAASAINRFIGINKQ